MIGDRTFMMAEGSFSFWSELWVDYRTFEVSGFEPDFISKFE